MNSLASRRGFTSDFATIPAMEQSLRRFGGSRASLRHEGEEALRVVLEDGAHHGDAHAGLLE